MNKKINIYETVRHEILDKLLDGKPWKLEDIKSEIDKGCNRINKLMQYEIISFLSNKQINLIDESAEAIALALNNSMKNDE